MPAYVQHGIWLTATLATFGYCWRSGRLAPQLAAMFLVLMWAGSRMAELLFPEPQHRLAYSAMDFIFGAFMCHWWMRERRYWKAVLIALCVVKLAAATAYWAAYPISGTAYDKWEVTNRFRGVFNVSFALQLATAAWAGGVNDWVRGLFSALPDRSWHRHHADHLR